MKRKARDIAVRLADLFPATLPENFAAGRASGILDHGYGMTRCDRDDTMQVTRHSQLVDTNDSLGAGRDGRLDQIRIDVVAVFLDIDKDRDSAAIADRICSGDEGVANRDDLVTRIDPDGLQGEMKCSGAIGNGACVPCTDKVGKLFFEGRHLRPLCNPP
jgi:hypothetical protein